MDQLSTGANPTGNLEQLLQSLPKWQQEQAKADFLEFLYDLYDRASAPLGVRGTYTGLWQCYQRDLAWLTRLSICLNQ
jgi:hypothetical protein